MPSFGTGVQYVRMMVARIKEVMDMMTDMKESQNQMRVAFSGSSSIANEAGAALSDGTTKLSIRASMTPRVLTVVRRAFLATWW